MAKATPTDTRAKVAALKTRGCELKAEKDKIDSQRVSINSEIAREQSQNSLDTMARDLQAKRSTLADASDLHSQREAVTEQLRVLNRAIEFNAQDLAAAE